MKKWICAGGILALALSVGYPTVAEGDGEITGLQIMQNQDKKNRAADEVVDGTMEIFFANGKRSVRSIVSTMKANMENDDDSTMIRFVKPAALAGTGLLTVESGTSDSQWLYLHDLRKSKRLAGASKSERFVDSDLANYDMRTEDLQNHEYTLMGEKEVDGHMCYVVDSKPTGENTAEESGYSGRRFYIDKEIWVPRMVQFKDRSGKALKIMKNQEYDEISGLWRAHKVTVRNVQEKTHTIVLYDRDRKINKGVDENVFTKRELERY